jgi:protein tyrosine phosphatase (PTP) superfamily phosphohydrolase (DUF442 family)
MARRPANSPSDLGLSGKAGELKSARLAVSAGLPRITVLVRMSPPRRKARRVSRRFGVGLAIGLSAAVGLAVAASWDDWVEKRVSVVVPGRLVRGAWQRPGPLRRIVAREKIKTIVTLTAINRDDPKYIGQRQVVDESGVDWIIVPMRGSRATLAQMAEAADLLADPRRQPVFFHCVAGHHRSSLAHAAYLIRHEGWSADRAWCEVAGLPWARPDADLGDRRAIEAFAARERSGKGPRKDANDATSPNAPVVPPVARGAAAPARLSRLEPRDE